MGAAPYVAAPTAPVPTASAPLAAAPLQAQDEGEEESEDDKEKPRHFLRQKSLYDNAVLAPKDDEQEADSGDEVGACASESPVQGCVWVSVCIGDKLPEGAVMGSEVAWVARGPKGECGSIELREGKVKEIQCHHAGTLGKGETLVALSDVCVEWRAVERGGALPEGAVYAGRTLRDGDVYVARSKGKCGKLNLEGGRVSNIWCYGAGPVQEGEILVVVAGPLPRPSGGAGVRPMHDVGWVARQRLQLGARDVSDDFHELLQEVRNGAHELESRSDMIFLLCPGLFCNHYPCYMRNTKNHFAGLGLNCQQVEYDTSRNCEENAACITKRALELNAATGKRLLLIGHSKGGCDIVTAVARNADELRSKVVGVVCLQSPLGGTPLADDLLGGKISKFTIRVIRTVLGGDVAALSDLTYHRRMQELEQHPYPHADFPILTLSSCTSRLTSPLAPLAHRMRRRYAGLETDGMVASLDADLPCSLRVRLRADWDHGGCAFPTSTPYCPSDAFVNETAVSLLLRFTSARKATTSATVAVANAGSQGHRLECAAAAASA